MPDSEICLRLELITFINFVLQKYEAGGLLIISVNDIYPDSIVKDVMSGFRRRGWKIKKEPGEKKYIFSN